MTDLLSLLLKNPHGWGDAPPVQAYQGEIRNALLPEADAIGQKYGPRAGALANSILKGWDTVGETAKTVAKNLSGLQMAEDAADNLANAIDRSDPVAGAGGLAQMGLAAVPAAGRLAGPLFETVPRMATMLGLYGGVPLVAGGMLTPTEAQAAKKTGQKSQRAIAPPPVAAAPPYDPASGLSKPQWDRYYELQAKSNDRGGLYKAEREEYAKLADTMAQAARGQNEAIAKAKAIEASAKAQREADQAAAEQARKEQEIAANTPFKKEHPFLSSAIPVASATLAAILGSKIKGNYVRSFQNRIDELAQNWKNTTAAAENALANGDALTASRLSAEASRMKDEFQALAKAKPGGTWPAVGAGAALGEFGQLVPLASDYFKALPGSELEKETRAQMTDPIGISGRILNGLLFGGLPAKVTSTLAGSRLSMPNGDAPKTDSLATILRSGGIDEPIKVQQALTSYRHMLDERLRPNIGDYGLKTPQPGNAAAPLQIAPPASSGGASSASQGAASQGAASKSQSSQAPHHSVFQPRDKRQRFSGPPKKYVNDNTEKE